MNRDQCHCRLPVINVVETCCERPQCGGKTIKAPKYVLKVKNSGTPFIPPPVPPIPPTPPTDCVVFTDSTLPNGSVDSGYFVTLQAQYIKAPIQWVVIAGELPPGLALDPDTGEISGSPTTPGDYSFTIQVTGAQDI